MLELSKIFSVSLDYLLLDDAHTANKKEEEPQTAASSYSGKITIMSFDQTSVINCISVKSSKILAPGKDGPSYILNGIDKVTFWGEHSTILGFYENATDVQKEMDSINAAIAKGEPSYKLQYVADVEYAGMFSQPKLKRKS